MLPGFECHGHSVLDGVYWKAALERHRSGPDMAWVRSVLSAYRDADITYFRDGGDNLGVSEAARELAGEYGVRLVTPCFAIHKRGCYGKMVGLAWDTLTDYRALIRELKRRRADFVKIMISGIISYETFGLVFGGGPEPEEIRELIRIAHGEGFAVMAHGNTPQAVLPALEAGVDSVEHGFFLDEECLSAMAETGAVWVPTHSTAAVLKGQPGYDRQVIEQIVISQGDSIRRAAELGVTIGCGSDAGAHLLPHGPATGIEYCVLERLLGERTNEILDKGCREIEKRFVYPV